MNEEQKSLISAFMEAQIHLNEQYNERLRKLEKKVI